MKIYITSFDAEVVRQERYATILEVDGTEYALAHSDVRRKADLQRLEVGSILEAVLSVDIEQKVATAKP